MKKVIIVFLILLAATAAYFIFLGFSSPKFENARLRFPLPKSYLSLAPVERKEFDENGCRVNADNIFCARRGEDDKAVILSVDSDLPIPQGFNLSTREGQEGALSYIAEHEASNEDKTDDIESKAEKGEYMSSPALLVTTTVKGEPMGKGIYFFIGPKLYGITFGTTPETFARMWQDMEEAFGRAEIIK